MRLNPADTILTNGNWYSDDRSEFFLEDLDPNTGFVIKNRKNNVGKLVGTRLVEVPDATNFRIGDKLTKVSGTGSFNASEVVIEKIKFELNTFSVSADHAGTGDIVFDARSTGYDPIVTDELYKEHLPSTLPAFVETEMTCLLYTSDAADE